MPPFSRGEHEDECLSPSLLEDPVRGDREREEETDEDLESRAAVGDRRVDQAGAVGQPLEPVLDADEDLVLDPVRLPRGGGNVGGRRRQRPERRFDLVERARDDQPE